MIHACYGSGCQYEKPNGECKKPHYVPSCPSDMTDEEFEDIEFYKEYWQDLKFEEERGN